MNTPAVPPPPPPPPPAPPPPPEPPRAYVRAAVLAVLDYDRPRTLGRLIRAITARTGGVWHPSPGTVQPVLRDMAAEGLLHSAHSDGVPHYRLADPG